MQQLDYSLKSNRGKAIALEPYTSYKRSSFGKSRPIFADKDVNDYINEKLTEAHKNLDKKYEEDTKASNCD